MALMHMAHRTLTEHFVDLGLLPLDFQQTQLLKQHLISISKHIQISLLC